MSIFKSKAPNDFHSENIGVEELKSLIIDIVRDTHPNDKVSKIEVDDDGTLLIKLDSGEEIGLEIDWNETVLL